MKKILLLLLLSLSFITCERDDICSDNEATTPRLVVDFLDVLSPEDFKNVVGLRVQGIGNDNVLEGFNVVNKNQVLLPLKTTGDVNANNELTTSYSMYRGFAIDDNDTPDDTSDDFNTGNEDLINITYTTQEIYVSRACGFKTVFNIISFEVVPDADNWITIVENANNNQTITNEAITHYNIQH
ncbi:DUF6452 family protein [Lacinutrix salivirga]